MKNIKTDKRNGAIMRFDVLTLFPELINAFCNESIIGRAREKEIIEINAINIRDYSDNKHKKVDDYPYGGGGGMLMTPQPVYDAFKSLYTDDDDKPHLIYMSPKGKIINQEKINEIKERKHIAVLAGHYEGIDQRVIDEIVDEEISIGDYVLTGGELPALILIDTVSRQVPGVLSSEDAYKNESIINLLLEYPQYTRPEIWNGRRVPDILLSGHHANIEKWRKEKSEEETKKKRPDLMEKK
jgi:tRNA (guanine37-N1)-methyltransferase